MLHHPLSYFLLLLLCSSACTPTTVIEPPSLARELVDLGFAPATITPSDFTPYFEERSLRFIAEDGEVYTFQMTQPVITDNYRFREIYPHPSSSRDVEYIYTGRRINFEFTSAELGARLGVIFQPAFCGDPRLDTDGKLGEYLTVSGTGFNNGDVSLQEPALAVELSHNTVCGEGRYFGTLTLAGQTFQEVSYAKQYFGERYLEIYYSAKDGIVALGTSYLFAVLEQ